MDDNRMAIKVRPVARLPHYPWPMSVPLPRLGPLHWTITFILLSIVTAGSAFLGTDQGSVSLPKGVLAVIFLGLAVLMQLAGPRTRS